MSKGRPGRAARAGQRSPARSGSVDVSAAMRSPKGMFALDPRGGIEARVAAGQRPARRRPTTREARARRRARPRRGCARRPARHSQDGTSGSTYAIEVRMRSAAARGVCSSEREQHDVAPLAPAQRRRRRRPHDEHAARSSPRAEARRRGRGRSSSNPTTRPGPAVARDGSPPTPPRRGSRRTGSSEGTRGR